MLMIYRPSKLSLINSVVQFWLHHTVHCTEKIFSAHLHSFCSSKNGRTGEVGGVTHRVLWTLQLLDLAVKGHGWHWVGQFLSWLHEQA